MPICVYLRSASQRRQTGFRVLYPLMLICVYLRRAVPTHANLCLSSECIPTKADRQADRHQSVVPISVYLQSASQRCRSVCVFRVRCLLNVCRRVSIFRVRFLRNANLCLSSECGAHSMPICAHLCVYLQSAVPISVSIFRVLCPSVFRDACY